MNKDALISAIAEKTELSKRDIGLVLETFEEVVRLFEMMRK